MKTGKKKENPFSFFSLVKEEESIPPPPLATPPPSHLTGSADRLPVFGKPVVAAGGAAGKRQVPNIFDDDEDDDDDEEDDDDDDDDEVSSPEFKPPSIGGVGGKKHVQVPVPVVPVSKAKPSASGSPSATAGPQSKLNNLFSNDNSDEDIDFSLEKLDNPNYKSNSSGTNTNGGSNIDVLLPPQTPANNNPNKVKSNNTNTNQINNNNNLPVQSNQHHEEEIIALKLQIEQLKEENSKMKQTAKVYKERYIKYKNEKQAIEVTLVEANNKIEQNRIKEANETVIMENMVAKVEENLFVHKKRAVQAEQLNEQYRAEIKNYEIIVKDLNDRLRGVKENGRNVSEQLMFASVEVEKNLKSILQGIENVKQVSAILNHIDRITTIPQG